MVGCAGAFPVHIPRFLILLNWGRSLPVARGALLTDMDATHVELVTSQTTYNSA